LKKILTLLILLATVSIADSYIFFPVGFAWHEKKENVNGRPYDTVIEGTGYQYRIKDGGFNYSGTVMILLDSNSNFMSLATLGISYNALYNINIGLEGGIASRVGHIMNYKTMELIRYNRRTVGSILPKIEIDFNEVMINIGYIPKVRNISQVVYINFGIKI